MYFAGMVPSSDFLPLGEWHVVKIMRVFLIYGESFLGRLSSDFWGWS
jgi:hypothetical protein